MNKSPAADHLYKCTGQAMVLTRFNGLLSCVYYFWPRPFDILLIAGLLWYGDCSMDVNCVC